MTDVYKELARKLDALPQGYPATESGIELRILEKIFSPEEAEMALKIKPIPETVEAIAQRLGKPVPEMQAILDDMVGKGQIGSFKFFGKQVYMFFPFVIGVYEFQLDRMDKELTEMFEEYAPQLLKEFGGYAPASARVVPPPTMPPTGVLPAMPAAPTVALPPAFQAAISEALAMLCRS